SESEGPKYLNSPETPIYHKSELLFGLDLARRAVKGQGAVIIVEGNLDVVASHKAGIEAVVASSGTALTERQLEQLHRLTDTLIFAFDQDAAGFEAAKRGIQLARRCGFQTKVALLPAGAGKDPDEVVQKDPALWRQAITHPIPVMQYLIERTVRGQDLTDIDTRRRVGDALKSELAIVEHVIEREHWMQTTADLLHMPVDTWRQEVEKMRRTPPDVPSHPPVRSENAVVVAPVSKPTRRLTAAEAVLSYLVHTPELYTRLSSFSPETFPPGELRELYTCLVPGYAKKQQASPDGSDSFFGHMEGVLKGDPSHAHLLPLLARLSMRGETMAADSTPS
ncbi:MAG: toprim domain-containing protein, partial [bacterium]|nr:toprim domain-containing protein [bacterium]